jgi:hypothetical protein
LKGSETADFTVSRFLLKPRISSEVSVEMYQPSEKIKDRTRRPATLRPKSLRRSMVKKRRATIYVNNRLEDCAPLTMAAFLERIPV